MVPLKTLLSNVIYKSSQNRGEDHTNSIILNKHIFINIIQRLSEEQLIAILVEIGLRPISIEGEEFGQWLESHRRVLKMSQSEFGEMVGATQSEVSRLEKNKALGTFTKERALEIVRITVEQIARAGKSAA